MSIVRQSEHEFQHMMRVLNTNVRYYQRVIRRKLMFVRLMVP